MSRWCDDCLRVEVEMSRWSVDPPDFDDCDYPFEMEQCDRCSEMFMVDKDAPRPDLILCDDCAELDRQRRQVEACLRAVQAQKDHRV